jgi:gliding motility-associated-like protein
MVNFINTSSGEITDWYWDMGDGTVYDTINSFQHSFYTSGFYDVMLWVSTDAGCIDSTRKTVTITEGVVIPNVFTPNGDGVNDEFEIITYGMFEKMEIKIYNRWGNLVWQNTDPLLFWDGKEMRSGDECAEGVYYYTFQATSLTGSEYSKNGSVTLLR